MVLWYNGGDVGTSMNSNGTGWELVRLSIAAVADLEGEAGGELMEG